MNDNIQIYATIDIIARNDIREEPEKRRIDTQYLSVATNGCDRHRCIVEEARKAHCRSRAIGPFSARSVQNDGSAFARRSIAHR